MGYTGRGHVVTFLDDGLEFDHPDLSENYVRLFVHIRILLLRRLYSSNRTRMPVPTSTETTLIHRHGMNQLTRTSKFRRTWLFSLEYEYPRSLRHGTRCAGEVAAKADNQICGVGIAYHARVGGIRMLDGEVTDSVEARSLSHRPDHVEIYSASW